MYISGRRRTSGFAGSWESASVKVDFDLVIKFQPYEGDVLPSSPPPQTKPKNLSFVGRISKSKLQLARRGYVFCSTGK